MIWSPRTSVYVATFLAIVMCFSIIWASFNTERPSTYINPCALVLTQSGQTCR